MGGGDEGSRQASNYSSGYDEEYDDEDSDYGGGEGEDNDEGEENDEKAKSAGKSENNWATESEQAVDYNIWPAPEDFPDDIEFDPLTLGVIQNGEEADEPVENDKKDESDEETKGDGVKP